MPGHAALRFVPLAVTVETRGYIGAKAVRWSWTASGTSMLSVGAVRMVHGLLQWSMVFLRVCKHGVFHAVVPSSLMTERGGACVLLARTLRRILKAPADGASICRVRLYQGALSGLNSACTPACTSQHTFVRILKTARWLSSPLKSEVFGCGILYARANGVLLRFADIFFTLVGCVVMMNEWESSDGLIVAWDFVFCL